MPETKVFGKQKVTLYFPDLLKCELSGEYVVEEAREISKELARLFPDPAMDTFSLNDVSQVRTATMAARKHVSNWYRARKGTAHLAVVGASLAMRTLAMMVANAMRLINSNFHLRFFADERDALRWFQEKGCRAAEEALRSLR